MNESQMSEALDAIETEALKLMQLDLPEKVEEKLTLIHSIARHKLDVRTNEEKSDDE